MKQKRPAVGVIGYMQAAVSIVYLVGIRTFLAPCGPKDDGSWMVCHWAGQAVTGLAAVLVVLAALRLLLPGPAYRMGVSASMIPVALLGALLPGKLIGLCMMDTMRCHAVTRPGAVVFSVLLAVLSLADLAVLRKKVGG